MEAQKRHALEKGEMLFPLNLSSTAEGGIPRVAKDKADRLPSLEIKLGWMVHRLKVKGNCQRAGMVHGTGSTPQEGTPNFAID